MATKKPLVLSAAGEIQQLQATDTLGVSVGDLSSVGPLYALTAPPLVTSGVATALDGNITNVATSLTVDSSSGFPAVPFIVLIGTEEIKVTNVSGVTWTVVRAYGRPATTGAAHSDNDAVTLLHWHWWYQQALGTATQVGAYIRMASGLPPAGAWRRAYARMIPASMTVLTVMMVPTLFSTLGENRFVGVFLGEGGTGKAHWLIYGQSVNGPIIYTQYAPDPFSTGAATTPVGPLYSVLPSNPLFLQVDVSTANCIFRASPDGSSGSWVQIASLAKTTPFTTAPDEWGVMLLGTSAATHDASLSLISLAEA